MNFSNISVNGSFPGASPAWIRYHSAFTAWFASNLFVGLSGGILSMILAASIFFHRQVHWGCQVLIIHLLLIQAITCGGFVITLSFTMYFPGLQIGPTGCTYFYFGLLWVVDAGQWSQCFLAVNRLIAIVNPHRYAAWRTRRVIILIIVLGWLVPFTANLPIILEIVGKIVVTFAPWRGCNYRNPLNAASMILFTIGLYLPIGLTFLCYFTIMLVEIRNRFCGGRKVGNSDEVALVGNLKLMKRRLIIVKMLFASTMWFTASYLPYIVSLTYFQGIHAQNPTLVLWLRLLYYTGCAGLPVTFLIMCKDYRHAVTVMLLKLFSFKHTVIPPKKSSTQQNTISLKETKRPQLLNFQRSQYRESSC
ncbi:somatostatin receptor type 5-like [Paramacrobiotus metropolitanus]|uniref:somatostatin receptor type 5-like n=1 Tax=Paramacrobiotus metropolitanus TaxID=2943436 RepID=UPI00244649ED|nr:somatostatin receptor type 5-like [Paramacrobiotus metropolitanus]